MQKLSYVLTAIISFFLPIQGLLLSVGIVIALDTITGVYRSVKIGGYQSFNSLRLGDVIGKLIMYTTAVIMVYILDKSLVGDILKIWFSIPFLATKIVTLVLVFIELVSIKENFEEAFKVDIVSLIKNFLKRTKEIKDDVTDITN